MLYYEYTIFEEPRPEFFESLFKFYKAPSPDPILPNIRAVLEDSIQDSLYLLFPETAPAVSIIPAHWLRAIEQIQDELESPDPHWNTPYPPRQNQKYFYEIPDAWLGR